ncbi:amino acid permease [Streptomonospora nanhaiensis]|uniref:APA family basic amino acid/polyamine antiporter n=1 Tax=Streptomonospora nanhaiensis TaxID=1323731 RepID=A0A853BI98_9ACTN|nr:amino acid permease [Streptomonospora nanhaiensis]MBV2364185.1 amino acid permease [Streptomonospora nanhaiensis]MBX9386695.1 amino acid permease [Streptomonospora nanhaiensis]NYI95139.1 APA family basic amino acid/polyamine antiporter [Streptomonospora nanhaiensis]
MASTGKAGPARGVFRRKPIDQIEETGSGGLQRSLGLWQLTAIGVGAIIGAGVFSLAGEVANGTAGPGVLFSFLVAGIASAAAAFSYAEFAGLIPRAGSAYTYGYAVLGEIVGWFIGWDLLLEYIAIVAVVAIGISGYFNFFLSSLGMELPLWMMGAPGTEPEGVPDGSYRINLFAVLLCLFIAFLLTRGVKNAARFETFFVGLKVAIVLVIIFVGVFYVDTANYSPFLPYGAGGVMAGAAVVFFAVFGYDAMSTAAEESKDAQRHMPKAIILSLVISMVLYVLACLVLTGMQSYTDIDPTAGFAVAFEANGLGWLANLIAIGAVISILTVMFTFMLGATRVWWAMSRDGLLPRWFAKTDPKHHVPVRVTWIAGVVSAVLAGLLPIGEAAALTNIGILSAFVVVCIAVIVLRYRRPDLPRTFKTPGMPVVPLVGVVFSIWLISFLDVQTWLRFLVWLLIGLVIYFAYSYRRSNLNTAPPPTDVGAER